MKYFASLSKYEVDIKKLKTHTHNYHEIIYYTSGEGISYIEGKPHPVGKGVMVVVPPKYSHGAISKSNLSSIWIAEAGERLLHLQEPIIIRNVDEDIASILQIIINNRYNNDDFTSSLHLAVVHYILNNLEEKDEKDMAVKKIKASIIKNFYKSDFDVTYYLNESGYNEDYIRAHFKKITGVTPIQFLTKIRIKHAKNLINAYKNSYSLADIAESCGYDDYIYFSRKFKEVTGLSPQKYKNSIE